MEHAADWSGLSGIGMVRSQAAVGEAMPSEICYAVTSLKSVERVAHAWRKHGGIENGLHCNSMLRPCAPFSFLSTILLSRGIMGRGECMKRFWAALVCAALWAAGAQAAPETPYDTTTMLWYGELSETQQSIFDLCYAAAARGEHTVVLPDGTSYDDAVLAVETLLLDCPELSWLGRYYTVRYYQQEPDLAVQIRLRFVGNPGETAALDAAKEMAAAASGDAREIALALHDALCERVTYGEGTRAHDAYGALAEGQAVCEGYAAAYALACRMAGIRCGVIVGTAATPDGGTGSHAWNLVDLGERVMLVDVTWDDQDRLGMVLHAFFDMSEADAAESHQEESVLPRPRAE